MSAAQTRMTLKVPTRLTSTTRLNPSSGAGPSRPTMRCAVAMPAQFTQMRAAPCASRARAIAPSTPAASETSQARPRPPISAPIAPAAASSTSSTVTFAPAAASRRAVSAPMPEPPPVTTAECPSMSMSIPDCRRGMRRDYPMPGQGCTIAGSSVGRIGRRRNPTSSADAVAGAFRTATTRYPFRAARWPAARRASDLHVASGSRSRAWPNRLHHATRNPKVAAAAASHAFEDWKLTCPRPTSSSSMASW